MDVTLMLNNNASVASIEKKDLVIDTKSQPRNRTPWDAGGYSLPIMNHQTPQLNAQEAQKPLDTQKSPAHRYEESVDVSGEPQDLMLINKAEYSGQENQADSVNYRRDSQPVGRHQLSDSQGSLSSFASSLSLNSVSHSRYSSTSTASGFQPLGTITDELDLDAKSQNGALQHGNKSPSTYSPVVPHPRARSVTSAIEPLSTLALIAERRSQEDLGAEVVEFERLKRQRTFVGTTKAKGIMLGYDYRSASPSDGLLIKRTLQQNLQEPSSNDRKRRFHDPIQNLIDSAEHGIGTRSSHKRTNSAPDNFRVLKESVLPLETVDSRIMSTVTGLTPNSDHPEQQSPPISSFDTTPNLSSESQIISEPKCMYIPNCDTNSTPRKAISHLLGRNKMCTRLIPPHIWVQYCRKHYQRARYRNMSGWPPLQCELVQKQIKRLHEWSAENVAKKSGPVVKDWTLALRKREQTRRDRLGKGAHKKSDSLDAKDESDVEVEDISPTRGDRNDDPPQAVPDWLFDMVGSGYSDGEISAIFEKIHVAILNKELPNMPDIEILPNIIIDRETPKETKGYVKRKTAVHQRSRSLGGAALRGSEVWNNAIRPGSQPVWDPAPMYGNNAMSPAIKRKRFDEIEEEPAYTQSIPNSQRIRSVHQDITTRRAGAPRAYSGWSDTQSHMIQQQNQQAHQQHQQYQQQMQLFQQHHQRTNQSYIDDMHARNTQYQQQHPHQQHNAYAQHSNGNVYPSPIMAPQPMRQPYMPTAQQLDSEVSMANRRGIMHQRARSDISFLPRRDDMQAYASNMMAAIPQQEAQQQQHSYYGNMHHHQAQQQQVNHYGQQQHSHQMQHHQQQGMQHQQNNLPRMENQEMRQQQFIDPSAHTWGVPDATVFRR